MAQLTRPKAVKLILKLLRGALTKSSLVHSDNGTNVAISLDSFLDYLKNDTN